MKQCKLVFMFLVLGAFLNSFSNVFAQSVNTYELMTRADNSHSQLDYQYVSNALHSFFPQMTAEDIGTTITLAWDKSLRGDVSLYNFMSGFLTFLRGHNTNGDLFEAMKSYANAIVTTMQKQETNNNDPLFVTGIISGDEPIAIIGGKVLEKGQAVNDYTISGIGKNYVEFTDTDGNTLQRKIGE